ncbi:MAG: glycosyl hydrolase [Chitinophagaceae bacterium]|nr:glycosyl hydrolase [Chitinophagaceae bacterium]
MKRITTGILFAFVLLMACHTTSKTVTRTVNGNGLTVAEKNAGWRMLFDGKTLMGWHIYGKPGSPGAWHAGEGALYVDMNDRKTFGGGDLVTNEEFGNFDFKYEWKISPKGNSGLIFYVKEDTVKYKNTYNTGPEMQVLDNDGHPDGKIIKHRAGDLYDLIKVSKETVRPVGEWNQAEIISNNGDLQFILNGENVLHTTMWDENWRKMVAGSKFKTMPGFGNFKTGKFALQDHGDEVWFRNIKIKTL